MEDFKTGDKIPLKIGGEAEIIQKLGEGGQGVVYLVKHGGKEYALKWYFGKRLKEFDAFYNNIEQNIVKGAPTPSFLWPLLITNKYKNSFGYLMDVRPSNYDSFSDFLLARVRFQSISAIINAALHMADGFAKLHRNGFSYQDLNDGNFFINLKTGAVLICDNDNVSPNGSNLGIAGKSRYMAPEVVLGKSKPNTETDRFSLAVSLFLLLFVSHPLEGKLTCCPCMTEDLERKFYASDPVFIFDPQKNTNPPVRGIHNNAIKLWPIYPQYIKDEFIKTFTKGINDTQNGRTIERQWKRVFLQLRSELVFCASCKKETFVNLNAPTSSCINCGKEVKVPLILELKHRKAALYPYAKIYHYQIDADSVDFNTVVGEIIQNKNNPNLWGMKNLSTNNWLATLPDGKQKNISNGEAFPLVRGIKIVFGVGNEAEIK